MTEHRRPFYTELTTDAYSGWQWIAARHEVSVTVLLEAIGRSVHDPRWLAPAIEQHPMVQEILAASKDLRATRRSRARSA